MAQAKSDLKKCPRGAFSVFVKHKKGGYRRACLMFSGKVDPKIRRLVRYVLEDRTVYTEEKGGI